MRVLAISDIHDDEVCLEKVKAFCNKNEFDHILIAGDITKHSISFLEEVLEALPNSFIIPGNNEDAKVLAKMKKYDGYLHEKIGFLRNVLAERTSTIDEKGNRYEEHEMADTYPIVGFGFSNITPFGTPGELTEDEIYERMSKLPIDEKTILLCHCPPYGYFDTTPNGEHVGSKSIWKIILEKRPLMALFGHIHELEGVNEVKFPNSLGQTLLVKIPAAPSGRAVVINPNAEETPKVAFVKLWDNGNQDNK
ncbi:MAG: metallophosphoesterase [Candidatus Micrarchaeota archaeon]